ncbi:MAG: sulfatase, partial [Flavobacteriaceae bacterium]
EERYQGKATGDDTALIMDKALAFMESAANKGAPFMVTLWPHTPHLPVVADSLQRSAYGELPLNEQLYNGTISSLDTQMGRLWEALDTLGIQDNTLIWFCSDNGPENNTPGSAGAFRGRKRSLYEGGVRVPAFAVWTSGFSRGLVSSYPMVTSDILPTLMEIWGMDYPDERPLDGISVWPSLKGKRQKIREPIGFVYHRAMSWVGNDYKLISTDGGENYEWYHLEKDPSEQYDLSKEQPERVRENISELNAWLASVDSSAKGMDYNQGM